MKGIKKFFKWSAYLVTTLVALYFFAYLALAYNKKKLVAMLNQELQKSISGEIHIGDIDLSLFYNFPQASLKIEDVYLRGPKYAIYHQDFLRIEELYVSLNIKSLFSKQIDLSKISLNKSEVFIFKTKDGYTNLDVFKKQAKPKDTSQVTENSLLLALEKLEIKNTQFTLSDSAAGKYFGLTLNDTKSVISLKDSLVTIGLKGDLFFNGLMFKAEKGTFLKNTQTTVDLNLRFNTKQKTLWVDSSSIQLKSGLVNLTGAFNFNKPLTYQLNISSADLEISEGLSVLTETIQAKLKRFGASGRVATKVSVEGKAIPNLKPIVNVGFATKNATANLLNKHLFTNLFLEGYYTNHMKDGLPNKKENSGVYIQKLRGELEGLNIEASASIENLADPNLELNAIVNTDLRSLNSHVNPNQLHFYSGKVLAQMSYSGKLKEYEDNELKKFNGKLNGQVRISNGGISFIPKNLNLNAITCNLKFNRDKIDLNNLSFLVGKDLIKFGGSITGFIPFFTQPNFKTTVHLNIDADKLDLGHFIAARKKKKSTDDKVNSRRKLYQLITTLNEKATINVFINAKQLSKNKFLAKEAQAHLTLHEDALEINKFEMQFAGGKCKLNGSIKELSKDWSPVFLSAKFEQVNMSEFMYAFNSFNMKHLSHENISGLIHTEIYLQSLMDSKLDFLNDRFNCRTFITIKEGKLMNFKPIMDLGKHIHSKRNFDNIEFAELKAELNTLGVESDINRMEISTNVLHLFVEGHYSLKDKTDLLVRIPLNNLKKFQHDIKPENIGTDKKLGASVSLKLKTDEKGKLKISYAPLAKKKNPTLP
ncbi:MAG: hypothetical protein CFE21_10075 [Bacteroidetes bacterium B1(2017)]|nr:MAG: hypothetical protein CFE21_10075 [Bacteroidetes bacterium B1(2017)]